MVRDSVHVFIDGLRIDPARLKIKLGPDNEKRSVLMKGVDPKEIQIPLIQDVEGSGFGWEIIEDPGILRFPLFYLDKRENQSAQIEKGMESDGRFGAAENSPREKRQTQVDGGRIEGIDRVFEFESQIFAGVKRAGLSDEDLGEVGIDAPIAGFVGMGQVVSGYAPSKAHMI